MKPVKVQPRFQCDFCKYRSVKSRVEVHEKRCFRNPNRFCDHCQNLGYTEEYEDIQEGLEHTYQLPCPYCSKFDAQQLKEIEAREKHDAEPISDIAVDEIPF